MLERTPRGRIPHADLPYRQAHPDQLAVAGLLHGLQPPPPATARVLELGCGAGGHLIATCYAMPHVRAIGVDAAAPAIEDARSTARAVGVEGVEFHALDVRQLAAGALGEFDYVVAHRLYGWISGDARDALLAAVRSHLAAGGLAYVSYDAQPGGHLRALLREACLWHARHAPGELERLRKVREMLELLLRWRASDEPGDAYGRFLADVLPGLVEAGDEVLAHDLLADEPSAIWYADFAAHAARHGLVPVAESRLTEPPLLPRTPALRPALDELSGGSPVVRQQLADLFGHGRFRETVLAPAGTRARGEPDPAALRGLHFVAGPPLHGTHGGPLEDVLAALVDRRPRATTWPELRSATGLADAALDAALLEALQAGLATAWLTPPRAAGAGRRPRGSALARWQARRGLPATSLLHTVVVLDPAGAQLLDLLDGTRDLEAVTARMRELTGLDLTVASVHGNLRALAAAGLLEEVT